MRVMGRAGVAFVLVVTMHCRGCAACLRGGFRACWAASACGARVAVLTFVGLARASVCSRAVVEISRSLVLRDAMRRRAQRSDPWQIASVRHYCVVRTHDQVEALSLADRVAVIGSRPVVQEGAPAGIYDRRGRATCS